MRPLRPLFAALTWRRWTFLLLGGLLALPLTIIAGAAASASTLLVGSEPYATLVAFALILAVLTGIGLLPMVRKLEGAIAVELLGAPQVPGTNPRWPARLRASGWFVAHLAGGAVACGITIAVPSLVVYGLLFPMFEGEVAAEFMTNGIMAAVRVAALLLVPATLYGIVLAGHLTARAAEWALGPSASERVEAAERRASVQAERTRLARELHDSVGHALSIVTVQSAAAERVLDRDPEFARQAMKAIEESARTALEDLDHVLGLLREEQTARTPQRTLHDLDDLLANTGLDVSVEREGDLARLPSAVSREAYRIVQEGLTNVAKHAGHVPVELRLVARQGALDLELCNPMGARTHGRGTGGRGLAGLGERVEVLAGRFSAGALDGRWRLCATIPLPKGTA
ncbi:histidine kinase [Actinocorallia sp. API 0066]|uniref:sensor histidine kinase n=1 Tax=Actinocorallia sp. API 0066 TaxID=2896846 RepID=UPI001E45459D|nr:histidine kinase [Actinocorallia sp. API 0066]MCD0451050.1 histidine kinase [Actinocorallia sp. API 0066]